MIQFLRRHLEKQL